MASIRRRAEATSDGADRDSTWRTTASTVPRDRFATRAPLGVKRNVMLRLSIGLRVRFTSFARSRLRRMIVTVLLWKWSHRASALGEIPGESATIRMTSRCGPVTPIAAFMRFECDSSA